MYLRSGGADGCVRWQPHVYGGAARNNVGAEGMKHLWQALQTNRTVTHLTIGGQLLCIVRSGNTYGCVKGQIHVHGAGTNKVGPEGMKHLGQALETNRKVNDQGLLFVPLAFMYFASLVGL